MERVKLLFNEQVVSSQKQILPSPWTRLAPVPESGGSCRKDSSVGDARILYLGRSPTSLILPRKVRP